MFYTWSWLACKLQDTPKNNVLHLVLLRLKIEDKAENKCFTLGPPWHVNYKTHQKTMFYTWSSLACKLQDTPKNNVLQLVLPGL